MNDKKRRRLKRPMPRTTDIETSDEATPRHVVAVEPLVSACHELSDPKHWSSGTEPPGPVDIYWEFQAGRSAHKFSMPIKCF